MTHDAQKIKQLEQQLQRERMARKKAEEVLRQKTLELFDANEHVTIATQRLQSALWASSESVWEWQAHDDMYRLYTSVDEREVVVARSGNLDEFVHSLSEDTRSKFMQQWEAHAKGELKMLNVTVYRQSKTNGKWRYLRLCGRFVTHFADGLPKQFVGIFKDVTKSFEQEQTFRIITDTYIRTEQPGFIIKLNPIRIEGTDSMFGLLGGVRRDFSQTQIRKLMPIDTIISHKVAGRRTFVAEVSTLSGQLYNCEFILPKMLDDGASVDEIKSAVGFFRPISE